MVYKLLIVIMALLVMDTSTQRLDRFPDLYNYQFIKHHGKRQNNNYIPVDTTQRSAINNDPSSNSEYYPFGMPATGIPLVPSKKSVLASLDLMNLLNYIIPREEISESVIFVPEEFEDDQKRE